MELGGLQKLTLLDFPGRLACTAFTVGCNFRCPWCHNGALVRRTAETFDAAELLAFLRKRQGVLDGVCISGGEPLLHKDLADTLRAIKDLGYAVKLDTNGSFPDKLRQLVEANLVDYVAMDVKNCQEHYGVTVGIPTLDLSPVVESVSYLLTEPVDFEFRTTVVGQFHNRENMEALARWIAGAKRYFLQSFVDGETLLSRGCTGLSPQEMEALRQVVLPWVPSVELRGT
ncbi:anaerobic ribonucleoside-triphosphate reductase activating protein [Candidatus Avoscillospira sp. LCP25S3_F1]|uniref:anaerobic ribonucleoside-triphosphate reductase activating protein n=1 Tax=Candidatus Avoscillospira sp. LCP25S3_F1 TaxID=3438825 RepID=UPI003F93512A